MDDYSLFNLFFDCFLAAIPVCAVLAFGFFCHAGQPKPTEVYDTGPDERKKQEQRRQFSLASFRQHLRNAQTDDDVMVAIEWAQYSLQLSPQDIESTLDEIKPLGSQDQKAALKVRRSFQLGHAY